MKKKKRISVFQKATACYLSEWLHISIMMHYTLQGLYVLEHNYSEIENRGLLYHNSFQ